MCSWFAAAAKVDASAIRISLGSEFGFLRVSTRFAVCVMGAPRSSTCSSIGDAVSGVSFASERSVDRHSHIMCATGLGFIAAVRV